MGLWLIITGASLVISLSFSIYFHKTDPGEWTLRNVITFPLCAMFVAGILSGIFILMFSQSLNGNIPIVSDKNIPIDLSVRKFHITGNNSITIAYDDAEPSPIVFGLFSIYPAFPVHFDSIYFDAETPYYRQIIREKPGTFFRFEESSRENILHLPKTTGMK